MITTLAALFAAAFLYPGRTAVTLTSILEFGWIVLVAAMFDAVILFTVARRRGWIGGAE